MWELGQAIGHLSSSLPLSIRWGQWQHNICFFVLIQICLCVRMRTCHGTCVEVKAQPQEFEIGSLAVCSYWPQAGWPATFWELACFHYPRHHRKTGIADAYLIHLYAGSGDLNSNAHPDTVQVPLHPLTSPCFSKWDMRWKHEVSSIQHKRENISY